jgi:uncharacterized membrane protein YkoI
MERRPAQKRIAVVLGVAALATAAAVGGAAAIAGGDDDERQQPIPATDIERAKAAALEETGGGTVTETEVDDEESKYEVEVTLNGVQVDVQLDEYFNVVGTEGGGGDDGSSDQFDDD